MQTSPLVVHFLAHPDSKAAEAIAGWLDFELFVDPLLPGLKVPTTFTPKAPRPTPVDFSHGAITAVVLLADQHMFNSGWPGFVGDVYAECVERGVPFIPIALEKDAHTLDQRLDGLDFLHAWHRTGTAAKRLVVGRVLIELCRCLDATGQADGTRRLIRLFLSHAKADLEGSELFSGLLDHLQQTEPIEVWFDGANIPVGKRFADAIKQGVRNTAMLVLLTDSFVERTWCRREVLLAKQFDRPLVVVDARDRTVARDFPYLGNVPHLQWRSAEQDAESVLNLVLRETLRVLHARAVLERHPDAADHTILTHPPELLTALPGAPILYPDPPLGDEELDLFKARGLTVRTPLEAFAEAQSLKGVAIAISTSNSPDTRAWGVTARHFETAVTEIARYLLIAGARLAYGGHLRGGAITLKLFDLITQHLPDTPSPDVIRAYVAWPFSIEPSQLKDHHRKAELIGLPRPDGIDERLSPEFVEHPPFFAADTPEQRFAWGRSLRGMRARMIGETRARVVVGGKIGWSVNAEGQREWYLGRIPGVLEECLMSLAAGHPLYLCGAFGGTTRLVIDLLEGKPREEATWAWQSAAPGAEGARKLFEDAGEWQPWPDIVRELGALGVDGLSTLNRLSPAENRRLFVATDPQEIVALILTGLSRLDPQGAQAAG